MPVYTVHGLHSEGFLSEGTGARPAADSVVLVRDGFHFWAFAMSLVWLVWHRLWWALLGYIALSIVTVVMLSALGVSGGARMIVMAVIALLVGFEAASLWRWTLSRGKWRQLDVIVADDLESAERRFFDRFSSARRDGNDRGGSYATRDYTGPTRPSAHRDIIGSFPQPGAMR